MKPLRHTIAVLMIGASLLLGLLIYLEARDAHLPVVRWFGGLSIVSDDGFWTSSRWMIYSLPDALWMFAFATSILLAWNFQWNTRSVYWYLTAIGLGVTFESLQAFDLVPGTFDVVDLASIVIAGILPIAYTVRFNRHEIHDVIAETEFTPQNIST